MPPPTTDDFRAELRAQIHRAIRQRRSHVEINAGELHRKVGGYPPKPGENHAMSTCCRVMSAEFVHGKDAVIFKTASSLAPAYTIRYNLPR
jgi:5-methylcytosine-specific restriction protein A